MLRNEWEFDGLAMTDGDTIREGTDTLKAGLDLEIPGAAFVCRKQIIDRAASGKLSAKDLDKDVQMKKQKIDWKQDKNNAETIFL